MKLVTYWQFWLVAVATTLALGCKPRSTSPQAPEKMEMRPFQEPDYGTGIPLDNPMNLAKSLESTVDSKKLVKIPVHFERTGSNLRAYDRAYIGTEEAPSGSPVLNLRLNDSALGVSLADRIAQHCPEGAGCSLWLVGYWHEKSLLDAGAEQSPDIHSFGIRSVVGVFRDGDARMAYIAK